MYKKDSNGNLYRIVDQWVSAWPGGGGHIAGYCMNELHEYEDGTLSVKAISTKYVHENPEISFAHVVYLHAVKELTYSLNRKKRRTR